MKRVLLALAVTISCFSISFAGEMPQGPYIGSAEFEKLKSLVGTWEGKHKIGKIEEDVGVEYYLTSNGSALVEKLFPGTQFEMISIYHDKKGKLSMTHYCAMGNQPQMDLASSNDKEIFLDFSPDSSMDPATENHMHSLKITWRGQDHITQQWTMYEGGKEASVSTFKFTRLK